VEENRLYTLSSPRARTGTLAGFEVSAKNIDPAQNSMSAMSGKVVKRRFRLPNVSIVQIAGRAKMVLTSPKPNDARRDCLTVYPAWEKMVDE
jgi:hypothetical protein